MNKNLVIKPVLLSSMRNFISFLAILKTQLLSFIEEKAPSSSGNLVTRIAYGIMSGGLLLEVLKEQYVILMKNTQAGETYEPPAVIDFEAYVRRVSEVSDYGSDRPDSRWKQYLRKLQDKPMCNTVMVAYSIPFDANTRRFYGNETIVWLISKLSPIFTARFLSDTYFKKQGFSDFFQKTTSMTLADVIEDSCLRSGFTVWAKKFEKMLEALESEHQETAWISLQLNMAEQFDTLNKGLMDLMENGKAKLEGLEKTSEQISELLNKYRPERECTTAEPSMDLGVWRSSPFYAACISIGAAFVVKGEASFLEIESVPKFATRIEKYFKQKNVDPEVIFALQQIPSQSELARVLRSKYKDEYKTLKEATFNVAMTEARAAAWKSKRMSIMQDGEGKSEASSSAVQPKPTRLGAWKYADNRKS